MVGSEGIAMHLTIGDYHFNTTGKTSLGDTVIEVTDYLGTDCGTFYGNVTDTEEDFQAMCEAYIKEMESPDYT